MTLEYRIDSSEPFMAPTLGWALTVGASLSSQRAVLVYSRRLHEQSGCVLAYSPAQHSRHPPRMSYIEVSGTVTAKQDGRTDIGMAGQVFRWLDKGVYKGCLQHSRKR